VSIVTAANSSNKGVHDHMPTLACVVLRHKG